jgi:hypothetical protein
VEGCVGFYCCWLQGNTVEATIGTRAIAACLADGLAHHLLFLCRHNTLRHPAFPDPRNWVWQGAAPSYAQAISSHFLDVLYEGELLRGDMPVPPIEDCFVIAPLSAPMAWVTAQGMVSTCLPHVSIMGFSIKHKCSIVNAYQLVANMLLLSPRTHAPRVHSIVRSLYMHLPQANYTSLNCSAHMHIPQANYTSINCSAHIHIPQANYTSINCSTHIHLPQASFRSNLFFDDVITTHNRPTARFQMVGNHTFRSDSGRDRRRWQCLSGSSKTSMW